MRSKTQRATDAVEATRRSRVPNPKRARGNTKAKELRRDGLWVATMDPPLLLRYPDAAGEPADTIDLDTAPKAVEIVDGVAFYLGRSIVVGGETLHVHDLRTGERDEIAFSEASALSGLVFADGSLWIGDEALDVVWRLNPSTREVIGGTHLENYDSDQNDGLQLAASGDSVYVSSLFGTDAVLRIGTDTDTVEARQEEGGDGTTGVGVGEGAAWAISRFDGTLWRYVQDDLALLGSVALEADLSSFPRNVVPALGSVFVLAGSGGNAQEICCQDARPGVFRVDPSSSQVVTHIPVEKPRAMRVHGGLLWVAAAPAAYGIAPEENRITRTLVPLAGEVVDLAVAQTGGGTGSTAGRPAVDIYTVVDPPPMVCENLSAFADHDTRPLYGDATATLTMDGLSTTFEFGACRALRNATGEVVEYIAYFSDDFEAPTRWARVSIEGYAGDGDYAASLGWDSGAASAFHSATASITASGRHAVVRSNLDDATLEFDCPADADVSLQVMSPPTPGRGEAIVHAGGVVFHFVNVDCGTEVLGKELSVTAPESIVGYDEPYAFELGTDEPAEPGTLTGSLRFSFYGDQYASEEVEVVLSCGDPVTGTFQGTDFSGSFTCM